MRVTFTSRSACCEAYTTRHCTQWLKTYIYMAHVNKKARQALHSKSLAKPFAKRTQDKRYWSTWWRTFRRTYLKRNPLCAHCEWPATVVDHIRPVSQGGDFYRGPFQPLCKSCHMRKSAQERAGTTTHRGRGETTSTT